MKILINNCFGGFGLSDSVKNLAKTHPSNLYSQRDFPVLSDDELAEISPSIYLDVDEINLRTNSKVIDYVAKHPQESKTEYSRPKVVEIPDNCHFTIFEYDGAEYVVTSASPIYSGKRCISLPAKKQIKEKIR